MTISSPYCWGTHNRTSPHLSAHNCMNSFVKSCNLLIDYPPLKIQYGYQVFSNPSAGISIHTRDKSCQFFLQNVAETPIFLRAKMPCERLSLFSFPITSIFFHSTLMNPIRIFHRNHFYNYCVGSVTSIFAFLD